MQVEIPFAGPSDGSSFQGCDGPWSKYRSCKPTPQYVHTVLVRRMRDSRMADSISDTRRIETVSSLRLDTLNDVDHGIQRSSLEMPVSESGVPEHGLLHQGVAGTYGHAVTAGDATGFADGRASIPKHAGVRVVPIRWKASRSLPRSDRLPRSGRTGRIGRDRNDRRDLCCRLRTVWSGTGSAGA